MQFANPVHGFFEGVRLLPRENSRLLIVDVHSNCAVDILLSQRLYLLIRYSYGPALGIGNAAG